MENFKNPTKDSIKNLLINLNLPLLDEFSQDWEYEVVDASRIEEFIIFYETQNLIDIDKFTLMIIIIGSCDDAISSDCFDNNLWEKIVTLLTTDRDIHVNTIEYWSCDDTDDIADCFYITPYIRAVNDKWNVMNNELLHVREVKQNVKPLAINSNVWTRAADGTIQIEPTAEDELR